MVENKFPSQQRSTEPTRTIAPVAQKRPVTVVRGKCFSPNIDGLQLDEATGCVGAVTKQTNEQYNLHASPLEKKVKYRLL